MYFINMIKNYKKMAAKQNVFYIREHRFWCPEYIWDMVKRAKKDARIKTYSAWVEFAITEKLKRDGVYQEYQEEFDRLYAER